MQIPFTASDTASFGGYFPEVGAGGIEVHAGRATATTASAPVRVVYEVKSFRSELEPYAFRNRKCLEESQIPILEPRLVDQIADPLGVERAWCR